MEKSNIDKVKELSKLMNDYFAEERDNDFRHKLNDINNNNNIITYDVYVTRGGSMHVKRDFYESMLSLVGNKINKGVQQEFADEEYISINTDFIKMVSKLKYPSYRPIFHNILELVKTLPHDYYDGKPREMTLFIENERHNHHTR